MPTLLYLTVNELEALSLDNLEALLLDAVPISGALPLYLNAGIPTTASGTIDLFIDGSTSGTTSSVGILPLYMEGDYLTANFNLYLYGVNPRLSGNSDLNLYLHGFVPSVNNSIDLVLAGGYGSGIFNDNHLNLIIAGDGLSSGYIPSGTYMNMYLKAPDGVESSVNLYTAGSNSGNQNINLYTFGVSGSLTGSINLYMPTKEGYGKAVNLFTRGYTA